MKIKSKLLVCCLVFICIISVFTYLCYKKMHDNFLMEKQDAEMNEIRRNLIEDQKGIYICYIESMEVEPMSPRHYSIKYKYRVLFPIRYNGVTSNEYFWGIQHIDTPATAKNYFSFFQRLTFSGIFIVLVGGDIWEINNEKVTHTEAIPIKSFHEYQPFLENIDLWEVSQNISPDIVNNGNQQIKK